MANSSRPIATQAPVEGTTFHGDGREQELARMLESRRNELQGSPKAVLDAMDQFGSNKYLMNVGGPKAKLVEEVICERKPKLVVELGTYVGYSAVAFGQHVKALHPNGIVPSEWASQLDTPDDSERPRIGYFCIEQNPQYAAVARVAIDIAGLSNVVTVIEGTSSTTLRHLRTTLNLPKNTQLNLVFLDHYKPLYTTDLKIMEQDRLVGPGTVLVADNVIKPGNPAYLAYVRASPIIKRQAFQQRRHVVEIAPELATQHEGSRESEKNLTKRSMNTGYEGKEQEVGEETGDPELVYVSELLESWDPYTAERDGVEVSRIVERLI